MSTIPHYAPPPQSIPLNRRINLRMIVFIGVILALVGFPVYIYLDSVISGGIKDLGNGFKEVNLKAMSDFSFDQNAGSLDDIPAKWRDLEGKKVVLYGELWSPLSAGSSGGAPLQLCYSIAKCCFTGPPLVQHFVNLYPAPNSKVEYYPNLVKVTGVLHVKVIRSPEKVQQIYQMDVADIEKM